MKKLKQCDYLTPEALTINGVSVGILSGSSDKTIGTEGLKLDNLDEDFFN